MMYSLSFFKNFSSEDFLIDKEIINTLIKTSKVVGNSILKIKENTDVVYKFQKAKYETKIVKVVSDEEKLLITIKSHLNKTTEENVLEMAKKISLLLDPKFFNIIFETSYKNNFYSKTYAMLVSSIANENEDFKNFILENVKKMYTLFDNMTYVSSENYSDFCDNNKKLGERLAFCCFYTHLSLLEFIEKNIIIEFIVHLVNSANILVNEENKKNEVDEILDIVYCLLNILKIPFTNEIIETLSKSTNKAYPSLSSKSIYKCMDILEIKI